jgi:hypothetical protein
MNEYEFIICHIPWLIVEFLILSMLNSPVTTEKCEQGV